MAREGLEELPPHHPGSTLPTLIWAFWPPELRASMSPLGSASISGT